MVTVPSNHPTGGRQYLQGKEKRPGLIFLNVVFDNNYEDV